MILQVVQPFAFQGVIHSNCSPAEQAKQAIGVRGFRFRAFRVKAVPCKHPVCVHCILTPELWGHLGRRVSLGQVDHDPRPQAATPK